MVVLLVDALGWELAGRTRDLAPGLPQRRKLDTILGFSSGALPTLFTGKLPAEHGRWLMYRRAMGPTPFAGFGWLRLAPGRIRRSWRLGRVLHRLVRRRGVGGYFDLYQVPRPLLAEFDLAERDDIFAPQGLPLDSLWDALARRGVHRVSWDWRTPETANFAALEHHVATGVGDFLFCYTAGLDATLHREGSSGAGVRAWLDRLAALIGRLEQAGARRGAAPWIYLLSDHGMVDVEGTVDVMGRLAALPVRWPADYLAFFDSTMARFWWRGSAARDQVRSALAADSAGRWLDEGELEREGCRFAGHEYGDDVFLLDPGRLMVPSFMGSEPVRAMHGYSPSHPDMAALLWSNRPLPLEVRHLADVRGFLERELEARAAASGPADPTVATAARPASAGGAA
jgi:type I phosphodiesterase/nucleotide pyrophosphatase